VGLALFALRYLIPEDRWSDRAARTSFWSLNLGLAWMVFANLLPIGIIQLQYSVSQGYFEARQLKYLTTPLVHFLEWLRLPGDVVFIMGGVLPLVLLCWRGVRHRRSSEPSAEPMLFTEVAPAKASEGR
jgi:nitric oxide reductase subunit B